MEEVGGGQAPIFQATYDGGTAPGDWQDANVMPIFNKVAKWDQGNDRQVSLMAVCCKLMESVLRDGMMENLERDGLIKPRRHGFMPGNRVEATYCPECFEKVSSVVDSGKPFDAVFRFTD